jgi:NADPH-dependent 2,4-dienoyl-CoA reductase/sulfur reductase-like enzyme
MSAAAKARRTARDLEIVVYEASGFVAYGSCGFPYFIKGEIARVEELIARTPEQFAAQGIQVKVRHRVLAIDPAGQTVRVEDLASGREFTDRWDALILATGGAAVRPPIPGLDLPGIFTLRTVEDAAAIRRWVEDRRPRRGVIVGGGYIGLEMAEALAAHGVELAVVEMLPQVLPTLDPEMAVHAQEALTRQGIALHLERTVEAFEGGERVERVVAGGTRLPADVVIFSVGVQPRSELARRAGIAPGPTGAVATDDRQRTSLSGIWAAGDVAEARHLVTGKPAYVPLGTTANKQGKVAGANAAGGDEIFAGIVGTAVVKVFDLTAAMTGLTETRARAEGFDATAVTITHNSRASYMPGRAPLTVKLVFEKTSRRVLGAQMVGTDGVAKRIDVVAAALQAGWTTDELAALDLAYAPPFAPVWDPILVAAGAAGR